MSDLSAKIIDTTTAMLKRAADILFVENPRGTSVGAFFGVALRTALDTFSPFFSRFAKIVDFSRLNVYGAIAIGVFVFNIPTLFARRRLPKEIEDEFEVIRRLKKEIPAWQVKARYLALCERVAATAPVRSRPTAE